MGLFDSFKKRPIDRVDGGEVDVSPEKTEISENAAEQSREEIEEKERKEKMKRFIVRISALMERVELLERKMDRVEGRLGIRDETRNEKT